MYRSLPLVLLAALIGFSRDAGAQTFVSPTVVRQGQAVERARVVLPDPSSLEQPSVAEALAQPDTTITHVLVLTTNARDSITPSTVDASLVQFERAVRTAQRERREFQQQIELTAAYPSLGIPENTVGEAVKVAAIAAHEPSFGALLTAATPQQRERLVALRAELLERVERAQSNDRMTARVYADGTIRGTATGEGGGAGVGTGALSVALIQGQRTWYASLTVASTEDTLSNGFGPAMLAPGSGKALSSGLLSFHDLDMFRHGWGLHTYLSSARHLWSVNDTARGATVLGAGLLAYRGIGREELAGRSVSLDVQVGPMLRILGGDVLDLDEATRKTAIGTSSTLFLGVEGGATISVGDLVGSVNLYYMPVSDDDRVLGFSNLQLVTGFSVKGELFPSGS